MHEAASADEAVRSERRVYRFFEAAVFLKGVNAILEISGGLLVLLIHPAFVRKVAEYFTAEELGQDPNDFIASHLRTFAEQYAAVGHHLFAAFYLLSHGIVKFILVIGLLKGKLWSYPASLAVFGLFILYQTYLFIGDRSWTVAALTLFDLVVMYFVWREWKIVEAHQAQIR